MESLIPLYPKSPRLLYLDARLLDEQSAAQRSNSLLELAIEAYLRVFELDNVPSKLLLINGRQCAERQSFRGETVNMSSKKRYNDLGHTT